MNRSLKIFGNVAAVLAMMVAVGNCTNNNKSNSEQVDTVLDSIAFENERRALGINPDMDRALAMLKLDSTKRANGITPNMFHDVVLSKLDSVRFAPEFNKYGINQPVANASAGEKAFAIIKLMRAKINANEKLTEEELEKLSVALEIFDKEREALGIYSNMNGIDAMKKLEAVKQEIKISPGTDEKHVIEKLDSARLAPTYIRFGVKQPPTNADTHEKVKAQGDLFINNLLLDDDVLTSEESKTLDEHNRLKAKLDSAHANTERVTAKYNEKHSKDNSKKSLIQSIIKFFY